MAPSIAIIGAGPGGAVALDVFLKNGYSDVTVFERRKLVGGTWNLDEQLGFKPSEDVPGSQRTDIDPPIPIPREAGEASGNQPFVRPASDFGPRYEESPLYPQVETNVLAEMMSFSEKPFPPVHPPHTKERFGRDDAYRTHDVIKDYVTGYFQGRENHVVLNTTVEKAFQVNGPGSKWKLIFRRHEVNGNLEEWWSQEFDFLYAASGRFNVPYVPQIDGLNEAISESTPGTIIHTKVFRDPTIYKDKSVVLIGASFSNVDIAHLILQAGVKTPLHLSLRHVLPTSIRGFAQPWIVPHPTISKVSLNGTDKLTIQFEDGETLSGVDHLIIGTGYRYSYPYLEEYLKPYGAIVNESGKGSKNLLWSTWWKYDSSLAVTSGITDSLFWRLLEAQAKASAALWKRDRSTWPTSQESDQWESARRSKDLYDFHIWYPHYDEILDGVAHVGGIDFGVYPDYNKLFELSFGLKGDFWEKEAYKYAEAHPETAKQFEETKKFLKTRIVTKF